MNIRKLLVTGGLLFISLATVIIAGCTPVELSSGFSYQGVLTDGSGAPLSDGSYQIVFGLYPSGSSGDPVYVVTKTVTTQNGIFSTVLNPPLEVMHNPLDVDLTVEGEQLPTRQRLWGAPYAMSLSPGATIDGYVYDTDPMSATLNIANAGDGIGLAVLASPSTGEGGNAVLAINHNSGDDVSTLKLSNVASDGRLIEAWNGNGTTALWTDREFSVRGNGDVHCDGSFTGGGADYADMLLVAESTEPGDVLIIGPDGKMARSTTSYATNVAGIHSTSPGFIGGDPMNNLDESDPEKLALMASLPTLLTDLELERAPVALAGVVPCKVSAENGVIKPGDLLVTSDTTGHAMRAAPLQVGDVEFYPPGTILGKAMESLDQGTGVILILVSLN